VVGPDAFSGLGNTGVIKTSKRFVKEVGDF